jgi:hypothetical protein
LVTLILWPFVIWRYVRLARREEQDVLSQYPAEYAEYMQRTPMFFPRPFGGGHLRMHAAHETETERVLERVNDTRTS